MYWFDVSIATILMWPAKTRYEETPLANRVMVFEDVHENKILKNFSIKLHFDVSQSSCGSLCLSTTNCFSFNYCRAKTCELNSGDSHSEGAEFEKFSNCKYFGMKVDDKMECEEKGALVVEKGNPGGDNACKTVERLHPTDSEPVVIVDTLDEWKKAQRPRLLCTAHSINCERNTEQLLEWVKFFREQKTWFDAKDHCRSLNGQLFFKLKGTKEQLTFFHEKLDHKMYWLGIWTTNGSVWVDVHGIRVPDDRFFGGKLDGEPTGENRLAATTTLSDENPNLTFFYSCDMTDN